MWVKAIVFEPERRHVAEHVPENQPDDHPATLRAARGDAGIAISNAAPTSIRTPITCSDGKEPIRDQSQKQRREDRGDRSCTRSVPMIAPSPAVSSAAARVANQAPQAKNCRNIITEMSVTALVGFIAGGVVVGPAASSFPEICEVSAIVFFAAVCG